MSENNKSDIELMAEVMQASNRANINLITGIISSMYDRLPSSEMLMINLADISKALNALVKVVLDNSRNHNAMVQQSVKIEGQIAILNQRLEDIHKTIKIKWKLK